MPTEPAPAAAPLVVAIEMGLGHLRAADSLARSLQTQLLHVDRPPLAGDNEQRLWARTRGLYEAISRFSQLPLAGGPLRALLAAITHIPHLHPRRDLSAPSTSLRYLERQIDRGLGAGLLAELKRTGAPLLTTFFAPALIADRLGTGNIYCLVTDADIARVWVPTNVKRCRVHYFAPSKRALDRLIAYGVSPDHVQLTGFPLPDELVGGPELETLRGNLAARLVRLDRAGVFRDQHRDELAYFFGRLPDHAPQAPLLTFAVGGAGAQAELARQFLPSLRPEIEAGRLRLVLMAGVRRAVADTFTTLLKRHGLADSPGARVVFADDLDGYFRACNAVLAETDILWTKPSEMTFYAALGLPLIFSWPVGAQERYNRRWAIENGAGLKQRDPRFAGEWIAEWLSDGTLAAAAWSGFMRLPKFGLYRIAEHFGVSFEKPALAHSHAGQ
ncbi:MAG TPA: hypothetical protein VFH73_07680 [Polyangia bacterium]|nr:hypothetical protein [Polyangia bacterium]